MEIEKKKKKKTQTIIMLKRGIKHTQKHVKNLFVFLNTQIEFDLINIR